MKDFENTDFDKKRSQHTTIKAFKDSQHAKSCIENALIKSLFKECRLFGPTGVYLLDFFCSGIQFNLLLSPYPCFISLLYLDLYVLGDDALIS